MNQFLYFIIQMNEFSINNISNIKSFNRLYSNESLSDISKISNINTDNITNIFSGIQNFQISSTFEFNNMSYMFSGCEYYYYHYLIY